MTILLFAAATVWAVTVTALITASLVRRTGPVERPVDATELLVDVDNEDGHRLSVLQIGPMPRGTFVFDGGRVVNATAIVAPLRVAQFVPGRHFWLYRLDGSLFARGDLVNRPPPLHAGDELQFAPHRIVVNYLQDDVPLEDNGINARGGEC